MKQDFVTQDGINLAGMLYETKQAKGVVLLNPGTATQTGFYKNFAQYLVGDGYHVFVWNYRGFCESRSGSLAGKEYKFSDIGLYDIPAAIDKVDALYPDLPLYCIGHSAGGQQFGLAHNHDKVKGLIAVAVSAGNFSFMTLGYRLKANFFFRIFAPLTGIFLGYVPAKRFDFMEDLTCNLAREWLAWCDEKDFLFSPKFSAMNFPIDNYQQFNIPIVVITAYDDEISTEENVANFWKHVASKKEIKFKRYSASDVGSKGIGHFGYFRKSNKIIWDDIVKALNEMN